MKHVHAIEWVQEWTALEPDSSRYGKLATAARMGPDWMGLEVWTEEFRDARRPHVDGDSA